MRVVLSDEPDRECLRSTNGVIHYSSERESNLFFYIDKKGNLVYKKSDYVLALDFGEGESVYARQFNISQFQSENGLRSTDTNELLEKFREAIIATYSNENYNFKVEQGDELSVRNTDPDKYREYYRLISLDMTICLCLGLMYCYYYDGSEEETPTPLVLSIVLLSFGYLLYESLFSFGFYYNSKCREWTSFIFIIILVNIPSAIIFAHLAHATVLIAYGIQTILPFLITQIHCSCALVVRLWFIILQSILVILITTVSFIVSGKGGIGWYIFGAIFECFIHAVLLYYAYSDFFSFGIGKTLIYAHHYFFVVVTIILYYMFWLMIYFYYCLCIILCCSVKENHKDESNESNENNKSNECNESKKDNSS